MVRINKVYTRTGDEGLTRLAGGQQLPKTHLRIEAYGTLDELNACLGVAAEEIRRSSGGTLRPLETSIVRIQNEIFDLGAELAVLPEDRHEKQQMVGPEDVLRLETEMDELNQSLPALSSFILPGGGMVSARLHVARTVCRRAERGLVALHVVEPQRSVALQYLNRLSDWLFVMGRHAAVITGHEEILWCPGQR